MKSCNAASPASHTGFTIVELMVTLVVAGILIAMAAPSYTRFVANSRIVDQTSQLIGAVNTGRSEAIRRNASVRFCRAASASATTCLTTAGDWQFWILRAPDGTILRRGSFNTYGGTHLVRGVAITDNTIRFGSDGLARVGSSGSALINAAPNAVEAAYGSEYFLVCSTRISSDNIRKLYLSAGSRITNVKESGACN